MSKRYWLMKSEPDIFGITDLAKAPKQTTHWEGVRNYQARNYLREMRLGDGIVFYHSNAEPTGAAGLAEVAGVARPDPAQFDPQSDYHDPKSKPDAPRWDLVDIRWVATFPRVVTLEELRQEKALSKMLLLRPGNRLSVTPVTADEWKAIAKMAERAPRRS